MISIATTYFNRKQQFITTLKSIERSMVKDIEVVAVDDASDESERIEDLIEIFPFLKVIRIDPDQKTWVNPCVPFNIAIEHTTGDIVVLQNPECFHKTDVLSYVKECVTKDNYISFPTFALNPEMTEELESGKEDFDTTTTTIGDENGWYNHPTLRPCHYHFCSAISKQNLKLLGGFDEIYANGYGFDDDDFIFRLKKHAISLEFASDQLVFHQHHTHNWTAPNYHELVQRNQLLFHKAQHPDIKVIGFTQLRNELEKGNLGNWFKCMNTVCDFIYIFDQNSTDGSMDYYLKYPNVKILASNINNFKNELLCKQRMLDHIKVDHPDAKFIMWLDGDELIDGRLLRKNGHVFKKLCEYLMTQPNEGFVFGHKNLWRSDTYERVDDDYDAMDIGGVCKLWKFSPNLEFLNSTGLHQVQFPINLKGFARGEWCLIHRGFSTDYQIITKYETYKSTGQSGRDLERLLDEKELNVRRINMEMIPDWFEVSDDVNPTEKKKIREIYNEQTT